MYSLLSLSLLIALLFQLPSESDCKCENPKVTSFSTYSTPDVLLSHDTVYSITLTLSCRDNEQPSLYAFLDDQLVSLTKEPGTGNYQISWTRPHKKPLQSQEISFYDDESASSLRKSMRYGEETKVSPLFTLPFEYKGIKSASLIAPGFIAMCLALLIWWLANSTRQKIQE